MVGIRLGGVIQGQPGPPFSVGEGAIGGGADQTNIWIVNGVGTALRITPYTDPTCTSPPCADQPYNPRLSPDGTLVAFCDAQDPDDFYSGLYVVPADGSATYPLTPSNRFYSDSGGYWILSPSWHPDGNKILVTNGDPGGTYGGKIVEVTYPGGVDTDLWTPDVQTPTQREEGHRPVYSPDGTKIAFIVNIQPGGGGDLTRQGLWVMDADGSNDAIIDNWDNSNTNAGYLYGGSQFAWSNDSQWIAYVDRGFAGGDGTFSVYKIQPDGTNKTLLADGSSGTVPHHVAWGAWLDDDSAVICTEYVSPTGWRIVSAAADGGGLTELIAAGSGPADSEYFRNAYRLRDRIYYQQLPGYAALIKSCALDGSDVQTYYDGTSIDAVNDNGNGFEWP